MDHFLTAQLCWVVRHFIWAGCLYWSGKQLKTTIPGLSPLCLAVTRFVCSFSTIKDLQEMGELNYPEGVFIYVLKFVESFMEKSDKSQLTVEPNVMLQFSSKKGSSTTVSLKESFGQKNVPHHRNTAGGTRNSTT